MGKITKAVIPAAGFGTRFLPATKAVPKEMLPVVDVPIVQRIVEEAVQSGIRDIVLVIGRGKRAIEEHFDRNVELELALEKKGKAEILEAVRAPTGLADIHFVWQHEMRGLGDAVRCARAHVGDEPFAVLLGDTLLQPRAGIPATRRLVDAYERTGTSVLALEEVPLERVSKYGVIKGESLGGGLWRVDDMVEKPAPEEAPSRMAVASRYVLTPDIFDALDRIPPGKGGELQLTDALRLLAAKRPFHGFQVDSTRWDAGNALGYLKVNIAYALERPDLREPLLAFLRETVQNS